MSEYFLEPSEVESKRLELSVARGSSHAPEGLEALRKELESSSYDLAILRIPHSLITSAHLLHSDLANLITADILLQFSKDLTKHTPSSSSYSPSIQIRPGTPEDLPRLQAITSQAFQNYPTHYHANPFIKDFDICTAYDEWTESHLSKPDQGVSVAVDDGDVAGYISWTANNGESRIDLNAVDPKHGGRGIYSQLLLSYMDELKAQGASRCRIATQLHNRRVQSIWHRWGLEQDEPEITFHWMRKE